MSGIGQFVDRVEVVVSVEENPDGVGALVAISLPEQGLQLTMSAAQALGFALDVAEAAAGCEVSNMASKIARAEGAER